MPTLSGTLGHEPNSTHQHLHRCNKQHHYRETEISTGKKTGHHSPQEDQQSYMLGGHCR